jgi:hypothetical protein
MIINNWYVAAPANEVGEEHVRVRMLGRELGRIDIRRM